MTSSDRSRCSRSTWGESGIGDRGSGIRDQGSGGGAVDDEGWLHTGDIGDIGERDADGRLFIRGRKKEMIVTPEGLNVFPDDIERALDEQPGRKMATPGRVSVTFGAPLRLSGNDYGALARQVEQAVRDLPIKGGA